jgi:hypothetical protein
MRVTIEMINNATGASVGAGTLVCYFNPLIVHSSPALRQSPQNLFPTTNLTIDQGAWKARTFHLEFEPPSS